MTIHKACSLDFLVTISKIKLDKLDIGDTYVELEINTSTHARILIRKICKYKNYGYFESSAVNGRKTQYIIFDKNKKITPERLPTKFNEIVFNILKTIRSEIRFSNNKVNEKNMQEYVYFIANNI